MFNMSSAYKASNVESDAKSDELVRSGKQRNSPVDGKAALHVPLVIRI